MNDRTFSFLVNAGFLLLFLSQTALVWSEAVWIKRHFKPSDGLAYQVVRDIAIDESGTVWFATWGGGISTFNGSDWRTINQEKTVSDYMIRCFAQDANRGLWVGTIAGIRHFDGKTWTTYSTQDTPDLANDSVFTILPLSNGEIWVGMSEGYLYAYSPLRKKEARWRLVREPALFNSRSIRSLLETPDGSIWVGGNKIDHFDGEKWTSYSVGETIYSLCRSNEGTLYAAGTRSLYQFDGTDWIAIPEAGIEPRSLACTQDGTVIVGTTVGLRMYEDGTWKDFTLSSDISSPWVENIRTFPDGSTWIGTRNGVFLVRKSDWSIATLPTPDAKINEKFFVTSPTLAPHVLSAEGYLYRWQNGSWLCIGDFREANNPPAGIIQLDDKQIILERQKTIVTYNLGDASVVHTIPITDVVNYSTVYRTSNGTYWMHGLEGESLHTWNGQDWVPLLKNDQSQYVKTYNFVETKDDTLWVVYSNQIEAMGKNYPFLSVFSSPRLRGHLVKDIHVSPNGTMWFGTSGMGLFVYDGKEMINYTTHNGLPNDWVMCVYEDTKGTIWAGMDSSSVASLANNRWIAFSNQDFSVQGRITEISEDPAGVIWCVVEPNGLVRYTPSSEPPDTEIDAFPSEIVPNSEAIFSFHGRDTWHMTHPDDLVYSWRILHKRTGDVIIPWSPFHPARIITSPPLSSGTYQFQVRVADKERNIDPTPATITFSVEPLLVLKPEFLLTLAIATLTMLYLALRWYTAHRQLVYLARIDGLTQLFKRDYCYQLFEAEIKRAHRYNRSLSILMIDIDHFKKINDTHGHDVGDLVLRQVAHKIMESCRSLDIVGRWGGEEFLVLLPETHLSKAYECAERIRETIQAHSIPFKKGTLSCTISAGIAQLTPQTNTLPTLLKAADKALYEAKANGRNRVETPPSPSPQSSPVLEKKLIF